MVQSLHDLTRELWVGQGALVNRGVNSTLALDLTFKRYELRTDREFRDAILQRARQDIFRQQFPYFSFVDASLELFPLEIDGPELKSYEAELEISGRLPYKSLCEKGIANLGLIVGAEIAFDGRSRCKLKLFPKVKTDNGNMGVVAEPNTEILD